MQLRLTVWAALFLFSAVGLVRAQTPTTPAVPAASQSAQVAGQIVAAKVVGSVSMLLSGVSTPLKNGDSIPQSATVVTQNDSGVVLVFSNGATTQLGADTALVVEKFLQDPFSADLKVADLEEEPSTSQTQLNLLKGELIGQVKRLKREKGSTYTIQTPVGAAGIRGTTFRIVFRPTGDGRAFAVFSLSTVEGNVNFQSAAEGAPGAPSVPSGVDVPNGQEVVVTVSVEVKPDGTVAVTAPPVVTSTQPISIATQTAIVQQAEQSAQAAATTIFSAANTTPANPANPPAGPKESAPPAETPAETPAAPLPPVPPAAAVPILTPGAGR